MGARDLLDALGDAGMSVAAEGDRLVIRPGSKLTDELRAALREVKPELLALLRGAPDLRQPGPAAAACTVDDAARQRYVARLLRLHWPKADAEAFAGRLVERDRSGDERVSCFECRHYWPGNCANFRWAGLGERIVSSELAGLLQRCSGFAPFQPK
ncbi:hypothetical protein RQP53_06875 [Paucibacter sp. APW11]|uniref:TubC N-terminal docking domain-containing protein n=1 Tax=Roseateles aquae TaxID=3077235 RepID=A0ABU3P8T8_9BURK|nr:hypothetical protein [Paucibacter sp. APW11]MDT8998989.1 hypothetical protein [Paucibacter sp. APW11]